MSSVIERPVDFGSTAPEIIETSTGRRIKQASDVRWVWHPFIRSIKLFDNLGAAVKNNLTLAEPPVMELKRCTPYPITNCEYEVSLHERKRYSDTGDEAPENDLPDNYAGLNPANPAPRHATESKYAYSSAAELSEKYSKEFGLVVLEPLTGVEGSDIVRQVFEMVQPMTYRLSTLQRELTEGAGERIRQSKASKEVKKLAEGCRLVMLKGLQNALATARAQFTDYSTQVQMASAGHKGNRAAPSEYDEGLCEQLGVEVPRVVLLSNRKDASEELLHRMAARELEREDGDADLKKMLDDERKKREDLEKKVNALLKKDAA